jgi:hypothetical protein
MFQQVEDPSVYLLSARWESVWESVRGLLEECTRPHVVRSGWRVEEPDEDQEFVFVCGLPTAERRGELSTTEDFGAYSSALRVF